MNKHEKLAVLIIVLLLVQLPLYYFFWQEDEVVGCGAAEDPISYHGDDANLFFGLIWDNGTVVDGEYEVVIRFYNNLTGDNVLCKEIHQSTIRNGSGYIHLENVVEFEGNFFTLDVDDDGETSPRTEVEFLVPSVGVEV